MKLTLRVLICGSRNWLDKRIIHRRMLSLPKRTTIIEGGARGADTIARQIAEKLGYAVEEYPANWELYGKAAGVLRNQQMLDEGKPELVIAFHEDIENSRGTGDMVRRARKHRIMVEVIDG